jgi:serine protease Do
VLTNEHVVSRADSIRVTLADGREFAATLIGAEPYVDLAVLELADAKRVPFTAPGSSADLLVGEPVIAIGNPFGLSNSVTTGVVSALNRSVRTEDRVYHGFLQTDASINPGKSGGPLLNAEGGLVGINTAVYQGAQGIGFAIPIDVAKRVVRELLTKGEVSPVWLGIDVQDLDGRIAEVMELPRRLSGALVSRVREDGPAAGSGVARGDVILRVDGAPLRSAREFYEHLERAVSGQALTLVRWREGAEGEVSVTARAIPERHVAEIGEQLLGMRLAAPDATGARVEAVRTGSGAERIGVQVGDRILGINGRSLTSAAVWRRIALDLRGRSHALVVVQRGRGRYHVTIPLS